MNGKLMRQDPWIRRRLCWMMDHQPERLRVLLRDPKQLISDLTHTVAAASSTFCTQYTAHHDRSLSEEVALNQLCPDVPPAAGQWPLTPKDELRVLAVLESR